MSTVERLLGGARDDLTQIDARLLQQIQIGERNARLQFELSGQAGETEEVLPGRVVTGVEQALATVGGIRWGVAGLHSVDHFSGACDECVG